MRNKEVIHSRENIDVYIRKARSCREWLYTKVSMIQTQVNLIKIIKQSKWIGSLKYIMVKFLGCNIKSQVQSLRKKNSTQSKVPEKKVYHNKSHKPEMR